MKSDPLLPLKPVGGDPNTPRTLLPQGSPEWCYRTIELLRYALEEKQVTQTQYDKVLAELVEYRAWEKIPTPDAPYGSLDALLKAEVGLSEEDAKKAKIAQQAKIAEESPPLSSSPGRCPSSMSGSSSSPINNNVINGRNRQGNDPSYLSRRIARDRPDILERMKAGEYTSIRQAAIEAGIVTPEFSCPLDPQKAARRILNRFQGDSLLTLVRVLANHAGYDLVGRGD